MKKGWWLALGVGLLGGGCGQSSSSASASERPKLLDLPAKNTYPKIDSSKANYKWSSDVDLERGSNFQVSIPGYVNSVPSATPWAGGMRGSIRGRGVLLVMAYTSRFEEGYETFQKVATRPRMGPKPTLTREGDKEILSLESADVLKGSRRPMKREEMLEGDGYSIQIYDHAAKTYLWAEIRLEAEDPLKPREAEVLRQVAMSAKVIDDLDYKPKGKVVALEGTPIRWSYDGGLGDSSRFAIWLPSYLKSSPRRRAEGETSERWVRGKGALAATAATRKFDLGHQALETEFKRAKEFKGAKSFTKGDKEIVVYNSTSLYSKSGCSAIAKTKGGATYFLVQLDLEKSDAYKPRQPEIVRAIAETAVVSD